jgi:simple sugar transport system ATP-binding protein
MSYAVEMTSITKEFPGVVANDNVTFQVRGGEIHALVGENGAGKTTLMNVLYGLYHPDSGQIKIRGQEVTIHDPHQAIELGVGMVHQHFMLVPSLTVMENVVLGKTPTRFALIDARQANEAIMEISEQYSLAVNPQAKVYELSVGEMQRVEILKALYRGADILILDEPTAVLTPQETTELFHILRGLAEQERAIIFITHKLKEVLAISDRVTVMRNGEVTGLVETSDTDEQELARLMVGRDVVFRVEKSPAKVGQEILRVANLHAVDDRGLPALKSVSFCVRLGQIVGVAGVEGNGQTELVEVLNGLRRATDGSVHYRGTDMTQASPRKRRELGISHIPEDRLRLGVNLDCTIEENLVLNTYYQPPLARSILLNLNKIEEYSDSLVERFNIITPTSKLPASSLSGGNMQKLVLAREMGGDPDLLIAAQPTRGVDVGAIEYIHQQIIQLRDRGHGVLLVSAELDEILSLSDRILVMYEGEIVGDFVGGSVSEEELGLYMLGTKRMEPSEMVAS